MCKYQVWVNMNYGWGTDTHANKQPYRHINTMTQPCPGQVKILMYGLCFYTYLLITSL